MPIFPIKYSLLYAFGVSQRYDASKDHCTKMIYYVCDRRFYLQPHGQSCGWNVHTQELHNIVRRFVYFRTVKGNDFQHNSIKVLRRTCALAFTPHVGASAHYNPTPRPTQNSPPPGSQPTAEQQFVSVCSVRPTDLHRIACSLRPTTVFSGFPASVCATIQTVDIV